MRLSRRRLLLSASSILAAPNARPGPAGAQAAAPDQGAGSGTLVLNARKIRARTPGSTGERDVLSFGGGLGGPVLRIAKGAALTVRLTNNLDVAFSLQWHGLRAPSGIEGNWPVAGTLLAPGAARELRVVPADSGLSWFHAAALPDGPDLTAGGLRGVLVVEEPEPPTVDRDVVLAVAEWPAAGDQGPFLTVNGEGLPLRVTAPPGARLRLRVVNAATTRAMILAIEGARPLIVAIDGQPSDLFEPVRDSVPVGPGARFEFMIDLARDADAVMRVMLRGGAGGDQALFECRTEGAARAALPPVAPLPRNPQLPPEIPLEKSARADLRIEAVEEPGADRPARRWRVNGQASSKLAGAPLVSVKRGGSVTLGFENRSSAMVPLRVHGHVMRLLHAKDDGWEPYWRDSLILLPHSTNHVAFVADSPGRWLIESALFDQAAAGLRSWFEVV